jgi:hypothetical protein
MKRLILSMGLLATLLGGLAHSTAQAGVIYSQGVITDTSAILNQGPVLIADTLGSYALGVTINGVTFTPTDANTLNNMGSGWANGGGLFTTFPPGSPLYNLLQDTVFEYDGFATITLSGLTPGQQYLLQLFFQNVVNDTGYNSQVTIQGQTEPFLYNNGQANYVDAYFTASGTSEIVTFGDGSGNEPERTQLNAFALESVSSSPEPGTLTMLGVAVVALGGYGWRRRKLAAAATV